MKNQLNKTLCCYIAIYYWFKIRCNRRLSKQLYEMTVITGLKSEKDMREQNKDMKKYKSSDIKFSVK